MILAARGKEVQFWIHLGNINLPRSEMMDSASTESGRPPLLPRLQGLAVLLRGASSFKEKPPATFRNLSADGTRIYDSVKHLREEIHSSQESSPLSSGRIQYPKLLKSASTTSTSEVRARVSKQHRPSHFDSSLCGHALWNRCEQDDMEEFALHLLVLAHAYMVPSLKRVCTDSYEHGLLNFDNVVDVLQVARLCDASRLYLLCLRRIVSDFKTVSRSDGWRIMKESDPILEQGLVEAVIEAETKRRQSVRKLEEDKVYVQLHDAMEALVHICRHGCRFMSPHDKVSDCSFPACKGLEYLVRHFAACKLKVSGGCVHCKRMWQLLELHSRMCTSQEPCKVTLCRHFKERVVQQASRKEEMRWKMLVRKVQAARASSGAFSSAAVSARLSQVGVMSQT